MTILIKQPNFSSLIKIEKVDKITYLEESDSFFIDYNNYKDSRIIKNTELISVK